MCWADSLFVCLQDSLFCNAGAGKYHNWFIHAQAEAIGKTTFTLHPIATFENNRNGKERRPCARVAMLIQSLIHYQYFAIDKSREENSGDAGWPVHWSMSDPFWYPLKPIAAGCWRVYPFTRELGRGINPSQKKKRNWQKTKTMSGLEESV